MEYHFYEILKKLWKITIIVWYDFGNSKIRQKTDGKMEIEEKSDGKSEILAKNWPLGARN